LSPFGVGKAGQTSSRVVIVALGGSRGTDTLAGEDPVSERARQAQRRAAGGRVRARLRATAPASLLSRPQVLSPRPNRSPSSCLGSGHRRSPMRGHPGKGCLSGPYLHLILAVLAFREEAALLHQAACSCEPPPLPPSGGGGFLLPGRPSLFDPDRFSHLAPDSILLALVTAQADPGHREARVVEKRADLLDRLAGVSAELGRRMAEDVDAGRRQASRPQVSPPSITQPGGESKSLSPDRGKCAPASLAR